jgi:hypothetical protein
MNISQASEGRGYSLHNRETTVWSASEYKAVPGVTENKWIGEIHSERQRVNKNDQFTLWFFSVFSLFLMKFCLKFAFR